LTSEATGESLDRKSCLYHYTSAQGLEGILRSRALWATDSAFPNDWQEIHFGATPLIARMTEYLAGHPYDKSTPISKEHELEIRLMIMESALKALEKFVSSDREFHPRDMDSATYVACLSEDHDDLGRWRGYGQHGYAIGLRRDGLKGAAPRLGQVRYGDRAVAELCDSVIRLFETRRIGAHPGTYGYFETVNFLMPELALVKHDAFQAEHEWRLVISPRPEKPPVVRVRTTSSGLTPYVECPFEASAVGEIVIGPGGSFHSERAVRMLLRANGYDPDQVQITQSRAPFRG
jgi:hypothetical protein